MFREIKNFIYEQSISNYKKSIEIDPKYIRIYKNMVDSYTKFGKNQRSGIRMGNGKKIGAGNWKEIMESIIRNDEIKQLKLDDFYNNISKGNAPDSTRA